MTICALTGQPVDTTVPPTYVENGGSQFTPAPALAPQPMPLPHEPAGARVPLPIPFADVGLRPQLLGFDFRKRQYIGV